ncbi:MAG: D-2-hydroxyacid dehydrogenase [Gemmatimonadota bacterium]|nr:MAG: D-2-hydroxyacid dehydrogenase [Gemmatimonadota bacterium]
MTPPSPRCFVIDMFSSRYPLWCMPEADAERIRAVLPPGWEVIRVTEESDGSGDGVPRVGPALLAALEDAEVYCGFGIPRGVLAAGKKLRWVHSGAAGVGGSLFPEMVESDVIFTNSAGTHGVPVAEHAVAMMFYFARAFDQVEASRRAGRLWDRDRIACAPSPVGELVDSVVGIIGLGGIGREVARRAQGLGMRVWALDRAPAPGASQGVERLLGPADLTEVLAGSDYVVISVPHTRETDGLIGAAELAAMKEGAVLINVSRGRIVDEEALIEALRARSIRGAGLDVYRDEPLPEQSPLWELDNVCLTPHIGGVTPRFWKRETQLIIENTRRYLAGEPLLNVVDKKAGY